MGSPNNSIDRPDEMALQLVREATNSSEYEGRLYLVGGILRDRAMGLPFSGDIDIVLEGDAIAFAKFLHERGISRHFPVLYPRFGTAMLTVGREDSPGCSIELVSARAESYQEDSRKPQVASGTLRQDVFRRDFTINTLLENLHTGEVFDITGQALTDLESHIIRTPLEPRVTFFDDPLRMLRAIRFAARFDFQIEEMAWEAIREESERLRPPAISSERIREEFVKIIRLPGRRIRRGMELLLRSNLLEKFIPEMHPMIGCVQGGWHRFDVWDHTLLAMESLPDSARIETRLALLWHDIGKPATRTEGSTGESAHFYGHPGKGAELVRTIMNRLKFSNDEIQDVTRMVELHMRLGEYKPAWTDASVKRLIRDCGEYLDDLFILTNCDRSAVEIPSDEMADLVGLRSRIDLLNARTDVLKIGSPLDGNEIMQILGAGEGPYLKQAKEYMTNLVIDGKLSENDKPTAILFLLDWWDQKMR